MDSVSIASGASYLRESALEKDWRDAFVSVAMQAQDRQIDRFCVVHEVEDTSNFTAALDRCPEDDGSSAAADSSKSDGGDEGNGGGGRGGSGGSRAIPRVRCAV